MAGNGSGELVSIGMSMSEPVGIQFLTCALTLQSMGFPI